MSKSIDSVKKALIELGQAYMLQSDVLQDAEPLALIKIFEKQTGEIELKTQHVYKSFTPHSQSDGNFALKFVTRGYLYIVEITIEVVDETSYLIKEFGKIEKSRLRKYFRASADINFVVHKCNPLGKPADTVPLSNAGKADISGGGFFFYANEQLMTNSKIKLELDLEECGKVTTMARIVRCKAVTKQKEVYGIACEFVGIADKDRDKILNFVSGIQRRNLTLGICEETRQWH